MKYPDTHRPCPICGKPFDITPMGKFKGFRMNHEVFWTPLDMHIVNRGRFDSEHRDQAILLRMYYAQKAATKGPAGFRRRCLAEKKGRRATGVSFPLPQVGSLSAKSDDPA